MSDFAENLAADRRTAARLLLREPLATAAAQPDVFPLIRRHADELARQFSQLLGYRLTVEPGFARLHKAGLSSAMSALGLAIQEESALELILADLL